MDLHNLAVLTPNCYNHLPQIHKSTSSIQRGGRTLPRTDSAPKRWRRAMGDGHTADRSVLRWTSSALASLASAFRLATVLNGGVWRCVWRLGQRVGRHLGRGGSSLWHSRCCKICRQVVTSIVGVRCHHITLVLIVT